jgi:hypothetical protein
MSGPPYPHPPKPGSNVIGSFVIGVSPIGTINPFDVWTTIISQYANSTILTTLIDNFSQYVDQTKNMDSFFDLMWNVDTAQGYGLDVWGRIVGVQRAVQLSDDQTYFGWEGAVETVFNQEPFFSGQTLTTNFLLLDTPFRLLIFAKALSNISDGSIASINLLLKNLFPGRGNAFATDGLNMTMTYTFNFGLTLVEHAVMQQSGVLPKPVGVASSIVIAAPVT